METVGISFAAALIGGLAAACLIRRLGSRPLADEAPDLQSIGEIAAQVGAIERGQHALTATLNRPGVRGRYGEISLRNLCEAAGLSPYADFQTQVHVEGNGDDPDARPDLVIRLPDDGSLVVDAKCPLEAFLDSTNATDDAEREAALDRHASQLRARVKALASKRYQARFSRTPDLVCMYVPSEASFAAAVERDPELITFAAERRVAVAPPAAMSALLQVVALSWREAAFSDSAERVRELASELVQRMATVLGHVDQQGRALTAAVKAHNALVASIESRLLVTARSLDALGIVGAEQLVAPSNVDEQTRTLADQEQLLPHT